MKRLLVITASVAVLVGAGASGAFAGEVKGPPSNPAGEATAAPEHSNSDCSYNGLNDFNQGPAIERTQTPANQAEFPGQAGHGNCAGGTNLSRGTPR